MLSDLLDEQHLGSEAIVHEVKRVGLLIDRYVDLEMRVGDHLVVYISRSQAWIIYVNYYLLLKK